MFGMKPEDAQGHADDMRRIQASHLAAEEQDQIGHSNQAAQRRRSMMKTMEGVAQFVAVRERDNRLFAVQQERNALTALQNAGSETIAHLVRDLSKAMGVSETDVKARYDTLRTQYYNRQVNKQVDAGHLEQDPRLDMPEFVKKWYVPGLDADHGF